MAVEAVSYEGKKFGRMMQKNEESKLKGLKDKEMLLIVAAGHDPIF